MDVKEVKIEKKSKKKDSKIGTTSPASEKKKNLE